VTAGDDSLGTRDRIFGMVAPTDWQLEAAEPPGLACTLYRYQRRCLAWLKWRESLGGGNSLAQERGPAESEGAAQAVQPAATAGAGVKGGVCPDSGSFKSKLQSTSLLWQPIVLPSGQTVFRNAADGCLRREAGGPPLPVVPGGLLCDEMVRQVASTQPGKAGVTSGSRLAPWCCYFSTAAAPAVCGVPQVQCHALLRTHTHTIDPPSALTSPAGSGQDGGNDGTVPCTPAAAALAAAAACGAAGARKPATDGQWRPAHRRSGRGSRSSRSSSRGSSSSRSRGGRKGSTNGVGGARDSQPLC
jgi:hypothetical protein